MTTLYDFGLISIGVVVGSALMFFATRIYERKFRIFRHYKGGMYRYLGMATHSETQEPLAVYQSMEHPFRWWVRPYSMFFEDKVEVEGVMVSRFQEIKRGKITR